MALTWLHKGVNRTTKATPPGARRNRRRLVLEIERFEDRLAPSTYQWTGASGVNWNNPGNWTGGPSGTFPSLAGDVAQFVDSPTVLTSPVNVSVNAPIAVGAIDFGSGASITISSDGTGSDGLTLSGGKIVAADIFGTANTGTNTISSPISLGTGLTLQNSGAAGVLTVSGALSGSGTLTVSGTSATTVSGNNSGFTGTPTISAGATLNAGSPNALGTSPNVIINGTLNIVQTTSTTAPGLAGTYYDFTGKPGPRTIVGNVALGTASVDASGAVTSVAVDAGGNAYTAAPSVTFTGGGGSGAMAHSTINATGNVTTVVIDNPGSGYTSAPAVKFSLPAALINPLPLLTAYAATLPVITTDSTATDNGWNQGGTIVDYGGHDNLGSGFPAIIDTTHPTNFMAIWSGTFNVPVAGAYNLGTASVDGSNLFIDGNLVVDNNNDQGVTTRNSNSPFDAGATTIPTLTAGPHSVVIEYYEGAGGYGFYAQIASASAATGIANNAKFPNSLLTHTGLTSNNLAIGSIDPASTGTLNVGFNENVTVGSNNINLTFAFGSTFKITGLGTVNSVGSGNVSLDNAQPFVGTWVVSGSGSSVFQIGDANPVSGESLMAIVNNTISNIIINNPSGNTFAMSANISGSAGITLNGTGNYELGGVSTFTTPVSVPVGATINVEGPAPLGAGDVTLPTGATINLDGGFSLGTPLGGGLPGTYYYAGAGGVDNSQFYDQGTLATYLGTLGAPIASDFSGTPTATNLAGISAFQPVPAFNYGQSGISFPGNARGDNFIGDWKGIFYVPVTGVYGFETDSDDGSLLWLDNNPANPIVNNNFFQGVTNRFGSAFLTAGAHPIEIAYYNGGGGFGLYANLTGPAPLGGRHRLPTANLGTAVPSLNLGSLAGGGTITLGSGSLNVGADNSSTTFTGTIAGAATTNGLTSFTKSGTGTLLIPNPAKLTYAGGTAVAGGTLQLGDGSMSYSALPAGGIVQNGTLVLNEPSGASLTYNGNISGSGGLTMMGSFTLTLGGNNTYSGGTPITAGSTVNATSSTALGTGDVTLPATATLNDNVAVSETMGTGLPGFWYDWQNQTSPRTGIGGNPPSRTPAKLLSYIATLGAPILPDSTSNDNGVNQGGTIVEYGSHNGLADGFPAPLNAPSPRDGNDFVGIFQGMFLAPVTGAYDFGTGSDDGSNIYVDGYLVVDNNSDQGYTVRNSDGPFDAYATRVPTLTAGVHSILLEYYQGGAGYNYDAFVQGPAGSGLDGGGSPYDSGFVGLPNANLGTIAVGPLTLGSLSDGGTTGGTLNINNSALTLGGNNTSTTFAGKITGSSPAAWPLPTFTKAGMGTLILSTPSNLAYTGQTAIDGGTLQLGTVVTPASGLLTGNITDNSTLSIVLSTAPSTVRYNGVISGSGGVTLTGNATLQLGGANSYTGQTLLDGCSVTYETNNALPPLSLIFGGSVIDLNGFNGALSAFTFSGIGAGVITNSSGICSSLTIVNNGSFIGEHVAITDNICSLTFTGSGRETLAVANTYSGTMISILGSTVVMDNDGAIRSGQSLTVTGSGVLDLNGNNLSVTSLSSSSGGTVTDSSTTPSILTINGSGAGPFSYAGLITGPVRVVYASTASTTLSALGGSTFSGGLSATSGSVAGSPGSIGTGTVTLNGGTLDMLPPPPLQGFGGNGTGWTQNAAGGPVGVFLAPDVYAITANVSGETNSIFYNTPVQPTAGFTASFTYDDVTGDGGDGITFCLQNDPRGPAAVGSGGGGLGSAGIDPSFVVALRIYNPSAPPPFSTLGSSDPINFSIAYDGNITATLTGTDVITSVSDTMLFTLPAPLATIMGSISAYVGFTGSTGVYHAQQVISNFLYNQTIPLPTAATYANNFSATLGTTSSAQLHVKSAANSYAFSGNVSLASGSTVNVSADSSSDANQGYSLALNGNLTLAGGSSLNVANNATGAASLTVNGTIGGTSAVIGTIGGGASVTLSLFSTYNVVLGGTPFGSEFTDLAINGATNLAMGRLDISLANNFAPALGESFTILHCTGPLTGTFAGGSLSCSGGLALSITYTANSVILRTIAVPSASQLVFVSPPSTAVAGTPFSLTVTATDGFCGQAGGFNGTVTLSSSAGADISPTSVTLNHGSATVLVTLTKVGVQTLTASKSGLTSATTSILVGPGAFAQYLVSTLIFGSGSQVAAGQSFLVEAQAADAAGDPLSSGYSGPATVTATINPANSASSFPLTLSIGSNGQGFSVGTLNQVGTYTISVADASNTFTGSAPVTVVPAVPTKLGFGAQPVGTPTVVTLPPVTVQIQDAFGNVVTSDNTDTVTLSIASGPGLFKAGSTTTVTAANGVATFNNLTLVAPGSYTFAEVVPARLIGPNSNSFNVAPLQVAPGSFASSPSGFSVAFNAPFLVNSVTPALYGTGFGVTATVTPTVMLTQMTGIPPSGFTLPYSVEGSVVLNTATNGLTFVETNTASVVNNGTPILPDGTYVATIIASGAQGLQAISSGGGYLDGTSSGTPGHDWTATFTISATAAGDDIVWVPATADGPLQPLTNAGNNQAASPTYPVDLNDSTGVVTSVNVTINYNAAMLTVTGAAHNSSLPGSTFTLLGSSTPGHAVLAYSGPASDSAGLTGGGVPLGFLQATVTNSAASPNNIYKGKDLLHLSGVSVNGGAIPAVGNDAVHLVAYVGDANGDGAYSAADAVLITRVSLQTDAGFAAYPLVDPVIVADSDGSGFIPADAALQANEAGIGFTTATLANPPIPAAANVTPIGNNVDPTIPAPVSAHGAAVVVAAPSALAPPATLLAAPLPGLLLQFANLPAFPVQGSGGGAAWQSLPNRQGFANWSMPSGGRGRRAAASRHTLPATVASISAQRDALDQVFAQAANETGYSIEDE